MSAWHGCDDDGGWRGAQGREVYHIVGWVRLKPLEADMIRKMIFTILLTLGLATGVAAIVTRHYRDVPIWGPPVLVRTIPPVPGARLSLDQGCIHIEYVSVDTSSPVTSVAAWHSYSKRAKWLGFEGHWNIRRILQKETSGWIWIPLWMPGAVLVAGPLAGLLLTFLYRRRTHRRGLCVRCGYDLTGNVSGTCPECGTAVPGSPTQAR